MGGVGTNLSCPAKGSAVAAATTRLSTFCEDAPVPDRDDPPDYVMFPTAAAFRAWLAEHHATAPELWVGYYKKGVARTGMTYREAVEEALCHGWIDGQVRRIDSEIVANRYTPRRPTSNWSAVNIAKIAELRAAGRMHPAGLRAFETRDRRRDATYSYERPPRALAPEFAAALAADAAAASHWEAAAPSYRRQAADWVMSAKRAETRERRFAELLAASREGRRPRPFLVRREERR
jgi:uncharacterized protein YdeI (YjbR/CyaY-like superfamily)